MIDTTPGTMLADRGVLRLSGEDVRGFLQGLVTNDLTHLAPDAPLWAGLLTPQGKALFDFILWADGDDVLIDAQAHRIEALARRLTLYRLRRAITIAPDPIRVHWAREGDQGVIDPRLSDLGHRCLGVEGRVASGWRQHRLALGVTEGVEELGDGTTLWLECNAAELHGVSFTKGCYVGQENTARMHHRSKVNRRLVVVPAGPETERTRAVYPDLELMIEHRRIDALGDARVPPWLAMTIAEDQVPT